MVKLVMESENYSLIKKSLIIKIVPCSGGGLRLFIVQSRITETYSRITLVTEMESFAAIVSGSIPYFFIVIIIEKKSLQ